MTRASKRPAPELALSSDDPLEFVSAYCKRRRIAYEIGHSPVEKQCLAAAATAREEYKTLRNARHASHAHSNSTPDRRGLSPAQKYTIRLHNNRKSANASKVYAEVLKREQAARLASIHSDSHHADTARALQSLTARVRALEQNLSAEKNRVLSLQKENQRLVNRLDTRLLDTQTTSTARNAPAVSMPEPVCIPASTPLHQRIVNSRTGTVVPTWTHISSLPIQDTDGKEFHHGLTCSQSQDVDEKPSSLPRVSQPMSAALQIGVLNSQPSQEIPPFKNLNSDDLVGPCPGSDFFNGSQPNSKLLCP